MGDQVISLLAQFFNSFVTTTTESHLISTFRFISPASKKTCLVASDSMKKKYPYRKNIT